MKVLLIRASLAIHEAVVANPRGCSGAVTRASLTIHDNLLNDGQIRMTVLLGYTMLLPYRKRSAAPTYPVNIKKGVLP